MASQNEEEAEVTINKVRKQEMTVNSKLEENLETEEMDNQDENDESKTKNKHKYLKQLLFDEDGQEEEKQVNSGKELLESQEWTSIISQHLKSPEFESLFNKHWHGRTSCKTENLEIIAEPFRVCKISNFIADEKFIDHLKKELSNTPTARAIMDLYQFEQTDDFKNIDSKFIQILRSKFKIEMASWMEKNTKIELNKNLSMSSSMYYKTDYLLCHDDNNEDRRIAFIWYLTENWKEEDGGELALFDSDENGQPGKVVRRILPEYNSLVFFEVTHNSYHQVLEVLTSKKFRWSINGWFHGPIDTVRRRPERPKLQMNFVSLTDDPAFAHFWVRQDYVDRQLGTEINRSFEEKSYEFLASFLIWDKFRALTKQVQSQDISWRRVGPPDVRNYEVADDNSLPLLLSSFVKFVKSRKFLTLLNWYTELDLIPSEMSTPRITVELQRWSSGCYTLINDDMKSEENEEYNEEKQNEEDCVSNKSLDVDESQPGCSYASGGNKRNHVDVGVFDSDSDSLGEPENSNPKRRLSQHGSSSAKRRKEEEESERAHVEEEEKYDEEYRMDEEEDKEQEEDSNVEDDSDNDDVSDDNEDKDHTELTDDVVKQMENELLNLEIFLYMIETKRVVRSFKEQFRLMAKDRERLYVLLYDADFQVQDASGPREDRQKLVARSVDTLRESWTALAAEQEQQRAQLEVRIEAILERYRRLDAGESLDSEYELEETYSPSRINKDESWSSSRAALPRCGLEVMLQFNIQPYNERQFAYYVDPREPDNDNATLIRVPLRNNYLCMVYKERDVCRIQKHVNHDVDGTFYNLVCTYWESEQNEAVCSYDST